MRYQRKGFKKMGKVKKILVVDDEPNIAFLIKEELEDEGYEVKVCNSGEEALKTIKNENFDLITLDIEMPEISGIEIAGKIREMEKDVKIVLLTAYSHYKSDLSSWAADAYIVKGSDFSELKEIIKKLLG